MGLYGAGGQTGKLLRSHSGALFPIILLIAGDSIIRYRLGNYTIEYVHHSIQPTTLSMS